MSGKNGHKFWSCLLLVSCVMCIVTGHQIVKKDWGADVSGRKRGIG